MATTVVDDEQNPLVPTAVSAPGKVLLAGGYLVLDRAYTGLVFGLNARIHAVIQPIPTGPGIVLNEISVKSPQFRHAVWNYGYRLAEREGGVKVTQLRVDADLALDRNPFIETTLSYVLSYITSVASPIIEPSSITIYADNDYYSTPADLTTATTNPTTTSPRFYNFNVPLSEAHKTGLGSSAALVTSITAALLSFYLPRSHFDLLPTSALASPSRRRLHNLAQAAHCAAQGKVGSGFDVASAVYGSSLYRRFSPSILSNHPEPGSPSFAPALVGLVEERAADPSSPAATPWDTEILQDAVKVPRGLRLVLCDVAGGSQTPGMVKQVLAWRAAQPAEADALWTELHAANQALAAELTALADAQPTGSLADDDGDEPAALRPLRAAFARIRASLRAMTRQTGVPIEPAAQTRLIDACEAVPGVVGGVVPGAGGYDAIALLIRDREDVVRALRELIAGWEFSGEEGVGGKVSMLGVREEMEGVRAEEARGYSL